jgi:hypothetical protein
MNTAAVPPAAASQAEAERVRREQEAAAQAEAERVQKEQEAAAQAERVKSQQTDDALSKAKERLDWAASVQARTKYPGPYSEAENAYNEAVQAKNNKNWDGAAANAAKVVAVVDEIERLNTIAGAAEAERINQEEAERVKAQQADDAIAKARERLEWASSIQAGRRFPSDFTQANDAFNNAQRDKNSKNYDGAINNAGRALAAVDQIERLNAAGEGTVPQPRYAANTDQDRARQADDYIARAKERIDWAISIQAGSKYPNDFNRASTAYGDAIRSRNAQNWDNAITNAIRAINAVGEIEQLNNRTPSGEGSLAGAAQTPPEQQSAAEKTAVDKLASEAAEKAAAEKATADKLATEAAEKAAAEKAAADKLAAEAAEKAATDKLAAEAAADKLAAEAAEAEKAKGAAEALAKAKERMDWANSIQARTKYPQPYNRANTAYNNAVRANTGKNYDNTVTNANQTIAAVAEIEQLNDNAIVDSVKAAADNAAEDAAA